MARRGGGEDGAGVGGAEGGELAGVLQEDADVGVVGGAPAEGGDGGGGGGELFLLLWGHGVVLLGCEDGEGGHPGRPRFARAGGAAPMAVRSVGDGAAEVAASGGDGGGESGVEGRRGWRGGVGAGGGVAVDVVVLFGDVGAPLVEGRDDVGATAGKGDAVVAEASEAAADVVLVNDGDLVDLVGFGGGGREVEGGGVVDGVGVDVGGAGGCAGGRAGGVCVVLLLRLERGGGGGGGVGDGELLQVEGQPLAEGERGPGGGVGAVDVDLDVGDGGVRDVVGLAVDGEGDPWHGSAPFGRSGQWIVVSG